MGSIISSTKQYIKKRGGLFVSGGFDILFFTFLMMLIIIGLVMLYSSSYVYASYEEGDPSFYFGKQLFGVVLGMVLMFIVSKLNYRIFEDVAAHVGTAVSWLLLLVALAMPAYHGTHRYIYLGGFQFQPSDVAKFALILTLAMWLDKYHNVVVSTRPVKSPLANKINSKLGKPVINDSLKIILICGFIIIVYAGLVAAGSHLSGTILILSIGVIMLFLGEIRRKWFIFGISFAGAAAVILWNSGLLKGYMEERITAWLNKDFDPLGVRWQVNQALYAIGSGGFFGKGIGKSTLKHLYVSEPQNDMIFSIVVEELGFVGGAAIILLFALLIWRGVVIGIKCPNRYGALVAMGIVFQLGVQVVLNIAVASDSIPNTGIALPFFSYGRTAILVMLVQMGFVLSISRTSRIKKG